MKTQMPHTYPIGAADILEKSQGGLNACDLHECRRVVEWGPGQAMLARKAPMGEQKQIRRGHLSFAPWTRCVALLPHRRRSGRAM